MEWLLRLLRDPNGGDGNGSGDGNEGEGSKKVEVEHQPPTPPEKYIPPEIDMTQAIPPEHRDKDYFKDLTFDRMVNEFVGLKSKLGERPPVGVPGADATPEQITTFYDALRPKDTKEYEFPETEFSKAHGRDEQFQTKMRDVFHKAGVSTYQAKVLTEGYDAVLAEFQQQGAEADQKFDDKITEIYGAEGRDKALKMAKDLMIENIPPDLKPLLDNLPNHALLLLTTTLNSVHKKYVQEDTLDGGAKPGSADETSLRQQALDIMQSKAYKDFREPGHDEAEAKLQEIYAQIGAIVDSKKQKK